ncbi:MAG: alanine--tRNA ligase [Fimbriimonas sp.]
MTVRELREKYLRFFESKGHTIYPSGSLVPYDVTGRLDESLLFNGAGMIQFKPYFRGVAEPTNRRLTTCQKCVRTGDIDETGDLSHLTFFEMLGNFSFGDYFKEEAIAYSWEFLTSPEWLGLDPAYLAFTVFEEDDEAYLYWATHISAAGLDPATRIFRLGEDTNYWPASSFSKGPPGPCGPNSEMFYWTGTTPPPDGAYTREDFLRDDEAKNWLEIWNDVFIQYDWKGSLRNPERPNEGYVKEGMPNLPFRSIDTGMGLDRTAAVLAGFKSVYDTDSFAPILRKLEELSGPDGFCYGDDPDRDRAMRIVADHIRTSCFCIADGVLPSNTGRGYVLRRLIRRAVLKGQRTLGYEEPFFHLVFEGVLSSMGDHYHELVERTDVIVETLKNEEAQFRRTLSAGTETLQEELARITTGSGLPGDIAFKLYDTYGFPLEVTVELCHEAGVEVDLDGYEAALKEAQERSRAGQERESVYGGVGISLFALFEVEEGEDDAPRTGTHFLGYHTLEAEGHIVGALPAADDGKNTGEIVVALDRSPFYSPSGGQVGDLGFIEGDGLLLRVTDLVKQDGVIVHLTEPLDTDGIPDLTQISEEEGKFLLQEKLFAKPVRAVVDANRRRAIQRNHTATHLLQAALRQTLGNHITQAGSAVTPDALRFDFTHSKAVTPEEIATVEQIVNRIALENRPVHTYVDVPIADARAMGAMALFGEKYSDLVRVVQVGDEPPSEPCFSRELCGGTHVLATGEIGMFKIVSEGSAAGGVRRIEAVTGEGAYAWALDEAHRLREAAHLLKTNPKELSHAIESLQEALREERKKRERAEQALAKGDGAGQGQAQEISGLQLWTRKFESMDAKIVAASIDDAVRESSLLVAVAAIVDGSKIQFVCKLGPDAQAKGAHAGNLVREIAKIAGGSGGGRADFATAGGKVLEQVDAALAAAPDLLKAQLK